MVHRSDSELVLDNIVFSGRNKDYGAYFLRHIYNKNLIKSMIIGVLIFSVAVGGPVLYKLLTPAEVQEVIINDVEVTLTEPPPMDETKPPPPPPPPIEPPKVASTQFLPPKIMEDEKVIEEVEPPKQEEMKEAPPAAITQEGTTNFNEVVEAPSTVIEVREEAPVTYVGEMPTFKDGNVTKYIGSNTKYPKKAIDAEIEGNVVVEFVIEKDGSITGVKVVKGIGYGCDEEAVRVVKSMDGKWTPGKNNGVPARVKKLVPINFKLNF